MSKKTNKKIFKTIFKTLEMIKNNSTKINVEDAQIYLTDLDGTICEIHVGVNENNKLRKTFDIYESAEEMAEIKEEDEFSKYGLERTKPLLN